MGFWKKLFGFGKSKPVSAENNEEWEQLVFEHEGIDFRDEEQRSRYVLACLDQIACADKETEELMGEYSLVTSYLSDMEEIEALPEQEWKLLENNARMVHNLEKDREQYLGKADRMPDSEYMALRKQEQTVEEGIEKLQKTEKYAGLVKQDLKKIDVERQAYAFRAAELENSCVNLRGMAMIFMVSMLFCVGMLALLQFAFHMDTMLGYFISILAGGLAIVITFVKYTDAQKESQKMKRSISRLIQLQNKVKIRYVNNTNLLEYLRMKYHCENSQELEKKWVRYQQEREERNRFAEAEARIEYYQNQLISQLSRYHLKDPDRWRGQTAAILDKREMVEIRHELILRRQALRKQLEYNKAAAEKAHDEVMGLANEYPAYRTEILEMVDKYQRESSRIS